MAVLPMVLFSSFLIYLGLRLSRKGIGSEGAELWLGGFFLLGGVSILPRFAIASGIDLGADALVVNLVAQAFLHAGICCFAAFVWRTFRPGSVWARRLFACIVAVYMLNLALFRLTGAYAIQSHPFNLVLSGCLAAVFAWGFVETLLFHGMMRRRAVIGLGDPVVSNRFVLFTVWTGGLTMLPLIITAVRAVSMVVDGQGLGVRPGAGLVVRPDAAWTLQVIRLAIAAIGPCVIGSLWLAFFPPARYVRWLGDRAKA